MPDPTPYTVPQTADDLPIASSDLRAAMQQYHDAINAQVDGTLADLQQRWAPVRATMDLEIQRLQQQMEAALANGDTLTAGWLAEAQRLTALKSLVEGNVAQFAAAAQQDIGAAQLAAIRAGGQAAQDTLQATVPPGVNYTFGVPPASVTAQFAGALQDGSPLAALFATFGPEAADRAGQALFTSIALGENPRVAAQRLQWATDLPRQRAEVIARTEILRSWRSAQLANYRANSDVVQGWEWSCDFSPRSCSACIALDGTVHPLDEELDDHICGRCSALPLTGSWSDILRDAGVSEEDIPASLREADAQASADARGMGRQTASEWLAQQPVEIQNQIMGPAKAEAWRQGAFNLSDLVGVRHDPQWGSSIQELSLKQMGLDAPTWLARARAAGNGSMVADAETQAAAEASATEMKTGVTTQPLGTQDTTALSESPVWQQIADTLTPPAETPPGEPEAPAYAPLSAPLSAPRDPLTGKEQALPTYDLTAEDRAFVQQLQDQLPMDGYASYTQAIDIGGQLHDRILADPAVARLQQLADEAADIRARLPNNVTEEERAWFAGNREASAAHDGVSPFRAADLYQQAYQARARAYLAEARELGGVDLNLASSDVEKFDAAVAERLDVVKELLPSDWLQAASDLGEITPIRGRERTSAGWQLTNADGSSTIALNYNKQSDLADIESSALHELTHYMESAVPSISQLEEQFYNARTAGDPFVDLTNGIKQQTKLDDWLDEYLGRQPLSIAGSGYYNSATDHQPYRYSYELMTMGVEATLAPGGSAERFALLRDREYAAFVWGVLFGA